MSCPQAPEPTPPSVPNRPPPGAHARKAIRLMEECLEQVQERPEILDTPDALQSLLAPIAREATSASGARPGQSENDTHSSSPHRAIFENDHTIMMLIEPRRGDIVDVNPAAAEFYGWPRHELAGKNIADLYVSSDGPASPLGRSIPPFLRVRHRCSDSSVHDLEIYSPPICIEGQDLIHSFIFNVSERQAMEDRIRQMEKMNAIGQLASGLAHDFNNQLYGILGYAKILIKQLEDQQHRRYATQIHSVGERASELVAQLLTLCRKGDPRRAPVQVSSILREVTALLSHAIDKRIAIRLCETDEQAFVAGDPTRLQNMLLNLGLNARDAMPQGGEINWSICSVELDAEFCRHQAEPVEPGRYVRISVSDTGAGMDEKTRRRIFDPFFTTKGKGKGTGLGLASVYGTVRNHQGTLEVVSTPGEGTTFHIYLPASDSSQQPETDPASASTEDSLHLLLVEDEKIMQDLGSEMLQSLGYRVTMAKDGHEALEIYRSAWQEIDLVLLDMGLPKLSGRDTFSMMKAVNSGLRAIVVTGHDSNADVKAVLDQGALLYVRKPYRRAVIARAIRQALKAPVCTSNAGTYENVR